MNSARDALLKALTTRSGFPHLYQIHQRMELQRVKPLPPHRGFYAKPENEELLKSIDDRRRGIYSLVDKGDLIPVCLSCPPLSHSVLEETAKVEIVKKLRDSHRERGGCELAVCRGLWGKQQDTRLLKVFDPMEYPFEDDDFPGFPINPVGRAEHDFVVEAAAYEHLDRVVGVGGVIMPKFHGAWALTVSIPEAYQRTYGESRRVFAIAMQYLEGFTLLDLEPAEYPTDARLNLLAKVLDAYRRIERAGVRQNDLAARNIRCSTKDLASPDLRTWIIDFNHADVLPLLGWDGRVDPKLDSNKTMYHNKVADTLWEMREWWPDGWGDDDEKWNAWLAETWRENKNSNK